MVSRCVAALVAVLGLVGASEAAAQRDLSVGLFAGSGLSLGTGGGAERAEVAMRRSPTFIDLEVGAWNPERPDPVLGAALRLEVDGRAAVGLVPRAGFRRSRGSVELRAAFGLPVFVAPFSLLGAEVAAGVGVPVGGGFAFVSELLVGGYFWGSDLPRGGALVKLDLRLGLEFRP